jgi:hypothetical protein
MPLLKTEKALTELRTRSRTLGLKERALLLLADGQKSAAELLTLVQADAQVLQRLVAEGYLAARPTPTEPPRATRPQVSADPFHGKRSLATARLYAMDMIERLFARTDPTLAQALHQQLRQAKDREAVVAVTHELLQRVEAVAGPARAESIRERLALLLPEGELDIEFQ